MVPDVGTTAHNALRDLVVHKLHQSERLMQGRVKRWRESERSYRLFVDPNELQGQNAQTEEQALLYPYPHSVVIPMSYAITQTLISFFIGLFSSQYPYFRIGNRTPESAGGAKAQQLLISYQLDYWGYVRLLHQLFLDGMRYGLGVVKTCWREDTRMQTVRSSVSVDVGGQVLSIPIREKREVVEYVGNYNEVIDPYGFHPDLSHPLGMFQDGSYCGESVTRSYFELLNRERQGIYANVREIPKYTMESIKSAGSGSTTFNGSDRERIIGTNTYFGEVVREDSPGIVLVETMLMDLIPSEHGLGSGDMPERWLVTIANRSVVIRAEEYPYSHQEYYYSVLETSPDVHSFLNPGVIEIMEPLAQHVSWLYNSHVENVRASLNNQLIVDPDRVNIEDILSPSAGKVIRLKQAYFGTGVDGAVKQLDVRDITGRNVETAQMLIGFMERLSAANDNIQGQRDDQRRTATENAMVNNMSTSRLRMAGRVYADSCFRPMARQMVQNNMEFMTSPQYLRIAGSLEQEYQAIGRSVQGGVMVSPEDIQGMFDYPITDATSPLDPIGFARVWMQVMDMSMKHPLIAQQVDHLALFKEVVGSMGVNDISRFLVQPNVQVMPDQQLQQQVQSGNLVPSPIQPPRAPSMMGLGNEGQGLQ